VRIALVLLTFALAGCAGSREGPAPAAAASALGETGSAERGLALARTRCGSCHALGAEDASRVAAAPPLRDIHRKYPVEGLQEAFGEGVMVGHPMMPQFQLGATEVADLVAYLKSFEGKR
jgi:mono/diheme cytochrome c family protein